MVSINYSAREVCCKIVYYGPGLSGKTTNLQYIHSKVPQSTRGKLISLATEADRTLYFDFLPINIGTINDFQAKFQLYTVPGQVYYNATRKLVLRGVDGVVFVADSQPDKMDENIESLANLEDNLSEYGYDPESLPLVIQYNKRDLPGILPVTELNAKLNQKGRPFFEASATMGNGVFDTLKLIIKLVLERAKASDPSAGAARAETSQADVQASSMSPPTPSVGERVPAQPVAAVAHADVQPVEAQVPQTAVSVQATVAPQAQPATGTVTTHRPFPGSDTGEIHGRKTRPMGMGRSQTDELSADSLGKSIETDSPNAHIGSPKSMISPQMAPSLRRRGDKKRRGFFKRLFGIK